MRRDFRPDVQGLRAVAVLAVLLFHAGVPGLGGGFLGVDVFFVVSGFLVGGHLLATLRAGRRIDIPDFYARRVRRILPAALIVLALTLVAAALVLSPIRLSDVLRDGMAALLSAANLRFAIESTDYLAGTEPSPLQHFWSLGVEEQFYLVVPLLVVGLGAVFRGSFRAVVVVVALVGAASLTLCLVAGPDDPWTFFGPAARAWELVAGMLAAVVVPHVARVPGLVARLVGLAGLAGILGAVVLLGDGGHPGAATVVPVLATVLVLITGAHPEPGWAGALLGLRPLQRLGAVSYALYLVHWPLLALTREAVGLDRPLPLVASIALAVLAVPLASLLHRFVEQPILRGRALASWRPRRFLTAGTAASVGMLGIVLAAGPAVAALPLDAGRPVPSAALAPLPDGTPFVPSNLAPSIRTAVDDTGALYRDGCQQTKTAAEVVVCEFGARDDPDATTVALFGDSHAGRWFPALESAFAGERVRLVTYTKSGCRSVETAERWADAANRSCAQWRVDALARLVADPPDVLVVANHVWRVPDDEAAEFEAEWRTATAATLARFPATTRVVLLGSTPEFSTSPTDCLARHLDDADACAVPRAAALNAPLDTAQRDAARAAGAGFVDLADWFCGRETCPVIVDATLLYTDEHHVSATWSARLGPALRAALEPWVPAPAS